MNTKKIYITDKDLNNFKTIGQGTDGKVFKYNNDLLIKIYLEHLYNEQELKKILDSEDKIFSKDQLVIKNDIARINYIMNEFNEEIKIRTNDAIERAIEKQIMIKKTNLPCGIVYLNNKFAGCQIKKSNGIQIHKLTGMPMVYKLKIIKNVLSCIHELLNNNVYHIDLNNSPYVQNKIIENGNEKFINGHSHILVEPFNLKTNIIDLDGKSTIYTETYNNALYHKSIESLSVLLCEFLFKINPEIKEIDEIEYKLINMGINNDLANKFANGSFNGIKDIKKELKL